MISQKLTFSRLSEMIGVPKALAAYVTQHHKLPSGTWSVLCVLDCIKELPSWTQERQALVASIEHCQGSFKLWQKVFEASNSWFVRDSSGDREKICTCALKKSLAAASIFHHWLYIYKVAPHSGIHEDREYIEENLIKSATSFSQLQALLTLRELRAPVHRRKILQRLSK